VLEASGFHPGRAVADHLRVRCAATGVGRPGSTRCWRTPGWASWPGAGWDPVAGGAAAAGPGRALLSEPEVLILDEPANGLDPAGVLWLRGFLRRLGDEGRTVLVSSHILAEVAQFADRVVVIDRGRLVSAGAVTELVKAARQAVVVRTPARGGAARGAGIRGSGGAGRRAGPIGDHGLGTEQVATLAAALGVPIFEMNAGHRQPGAGLPAADRCGREAGMTAALCAEFLKLRTTGWWPG